MLALKRLIGVLLFSSLFFGLGCGFDPGDSSKEAENAEQRDRERLRKAYDELNGLYVGKTSDGIPQEFVMILETVNVSSGKSSDGKERFTVALEGFMILVGALETYGLKGTLYRDSGEVILVNREGEPSFSLERAVFDSAQSQINGVVRERGGRIGSVKFSRISSSIKTPEDGWEEFSKDRSECFIQNISGVFKGKIEVSEAYKRSGRNFLEHFALDISAVDKTNLKALYVFTDKNGNANNNVMPRVLEGSYDPRSGFISMENPNAANKMFTVAGEISEEAGEVRNLKVSNNIGYIGSGNGVDEVKVERIEQCRLDSTCDPGDEDCLASCARSCDDKAFLLKHLK